MLFSLINDFATKEIIYNHNYIVLILELKMSLSSEG